jgi:hypothetical protein
MSHLVKLLPKCDGNAGSWLHSADRRRDRLCRRVGCSHHLPAWHVRFASKADKQQTASVADETTDIATTRNAADLAALRTFITRLEKEAREREPKRS